MKWNKLMILGFMVFVVSCTKMEIEPIPQPTTENIFSVGESTVTDGQIIQFDLPSDGVYILTYTDVQNGQVISREKFIGYIGKNIKKIYTKSIMSKYLYLTLESENRTQISKTKIIIN
jgi:hypothetical protein